MKTAKHDTNYLSEINKKLSWPAQSPDPIQHLRGDLECQLQAGPCHPTSVPPLTNVLVSEWQQMRTKRS